LLIKCDQEKAKSRGVGRIKFGSHGKERKRKKKKVWARRRHVTFITGKVIRKMIATIGKSG